ncbi:hypothetical protein GIB67_039792 [Kingdonia uniflora]|uniref:Uncharacterized protein n=1 Tax=Kingdonia uniflora TaxID=39325 RepID=A0A7J7P336_9MAGN|nr:hypothetical protein GIB67_039792 [Kingdonia uniflora]
MYWHMNQRTVDYMVRITQRISGPTYQKSISTPTYQKRIVCNKLKLFTVTIYWSTSSKNSSRSQKVEERNCLLRGVVILQPLLQQEDIQMYKCLQFLSFYSPSSSAICQNIWTCLQFLKFYSLSSREICQKVRKFLQI